MFDPSSFANPTPLAHADASRDVLPRGGTSQPNDVKSSNTMRRHSTPYHHFCRVPYSGLQTLRAEFLMSASSYIGTTLVARNTKMTLVTKYYLFPVFNSP
ncbi:hypothetical protein TNCV_1633641 [Trichonephila clavipes]|nr:hypothetical protein TNCV_1633641 [Trichonephila clavipes]